MRADLQGWLAEGERPSKFTTYRDRLRSMRKTLARSASFFPIETHARSLRDDRPRWLPNTVLPLRAWHDAARQTLSLRAVSFDFERSFQLPDNIEADKIEATFKKGRVVDDPAQECRSAKASKEDRGEGPADTQS